MTRQMSYFEPMEALCNRCKKPMMKRSMRHRMHLECRKAKYVQVKKRMVPKKSIEAFIATCLHCNCPMVRRNGNQLYHEACMKVRMKIKRREYIRRKYPEIKPRVPAANKDRWYYRNKSKALARRKWLYEWKKASIAFMTPISFYIEQCRGGVR